MTALFTNSLVYIIVILSNYNCMVISWVQSYKNVPIIFSPKIILFHMIKIKIRRRKIILSNFPGHYQLLPVGKKFKLGRRQPWAKAAFLTLVVWVIHWLRFPFRQNFAYFLKNVARLKIGKKFQTCFATFCKINFFAGYDAY